jgi:hypothetical protein
MRFYSDYDIDWTGIAGWCWDARPILTVLTLVAAIGLSAVLARALRRLAVAPVESEPEAKELS